MAKPPAPQDVLIRVRLTAEVKRAADAGRRQAGVPLSTYVRLALIEKLRRENLLT